MEHGVLGVEAREVELPTRRPVGRGCAACPRAEACQQLQGWGLWCLCEVELPLEADLNVARMIGVDLEAYRGNW